MFERPEGMIEFINCPVCKRNTMPRGNDYCSLSCHKTDNENEKSASENLE